MIIIKGDLNGDGKIDGTDYILKKMHENGQITLSGNSATAADGITSTDIYNHIFGYSALTEIIET